MAIMRGILPTDSFTIISNAWLRDSSLSWKAKGLLAYIASHAAGHALTLEQILAEGTDKIDAVRSGLGELEGLGYLRRHDVRDGKGHRVGTDFELLDPGVESPGGKIQSGADQGEQDVSAGQPQVGKTQVGKSDPKKTTPSKKTTEEDQGAFDAEASPTARTILGAFIDWVGLPAQGGVRLSKRVIGIYAKSIKELLGEGFSENLIKMALVAMLEKGLADRPTLLHNFVVQVQQQSARPVSAPPAPKTFKQMDEGDRDREYKIVLAMDVVLRQEPSLDVAEARKIVMDMVAAGQLDLNALSTSAATGYIEQDVIVSEVKEVTGS